MAGSGIVTSGGRRRGAGAELARWRQSMLPRVAPPADHRLAEEHGECTGQAPAEQRRALGFDDL